LLGAVAALTQLPGLVVTGALLVGTLVVAAYWRGRSKDFGITTEIALLLTYLIGVICSTSKPLAGALAVGLTGVLAGRERLHLWAVQWLRPGEVRDGIVLAALVLIALPLVPQQPLWDDVLKPHAIVQLLALLLGVQSLAHLSQRLLRARQAVAMSALASGFVSSTATIATLGLSVRERPQDVRLLAGGGLLSCVSTQLQILLVASAIQPAWLENLWLPCLAAGALALLWGGWMVRDAALNPTTQPMQPDEDRMFSLWGAAGVAALLSVIQVGVHALELWLGDSGLLLGATLAALADLHASLAAVFASGPPALGGVAVWAMMLAVSVHAASKSLTAGLTGGWRYLLALAPGLWGHTALCVAGVYATTR